MLKKSSLGIFLNKNPFFDLFPTPPPPQEKAVN
jgi:hypothetical protein